MTSEDPVEDLLKSVQIYIKAKCFLLHVTVHLLQLNFGDEIVRITDR